MPNLSRLFGWGLQLMKIGTHFWKMKKAILTLVVFGLGFLLSWPASAGENTVCAVYFTGLGCSHCAKAGPVIEKLLEKYPNFTVIKYEIYKKRENAPLLLRYNENYGSGLGIPLLIFGKGEFLAGDNPIIRDTEVVLKDKTSNLCSLPDGSRVSFGELDLSSLPGSPEIVGGPRGVVAGVRTGQKDADLTLAKVLSLASADAVNPCALAVLTAMLLAILTYNPEKKRKILWAGLAFTSSVFIMYFGYGLLIIKFFQVAKALTSVRPILYKALAVLAIALGVLDIREFVSGSSTCRVVPKIGKLLSRITGPRGAFTIGALVTIFLLPCTIGPYVICGGILSTLSLLKTLPWLLVYNLVFVLPMVGVTIIAYLGFSTVESISGWQERNVKYFNLAAGLIILGLGLVMLLGWL